MAEKKRNAFIKKVVKDPASPPETLVVSGYIGDSGEEGHTRVYLDLELSSYYDIPDDAILHKEDLDQEAMPFQRDVVWVDRAAADRLKGRFPEPIFGGGGGLPGGWPPDGPLRTPGSPACPFTPAFGCPPTALNPPCQPTPGGGFCQFTPGFGCPTPPNFCPTGTNCPTPPNLCPVTPGHGCPTPPNLCPVTPGHGCPTPPNLCPVTPGCPTLPSACCPTPPPNFCPVTPGHGCPTPPNFCPVTPGHGCPTPPNLCPQPTGALSCRTVFPNACHVTSPPICVQRTFDPGCFPTLGGCQSAVDACPTGFCPPGGGGFTPQGGGGFTPQGGFTPPGG